MEGTHNELHGLLTRIQDSLLHYADILLECMHPFLSEKIQKKFPNNIEDFVALQKGILSLQEKVRNIPIQEIQGMQSSDPNQIFSFLSKLRHDLRNNINVIMGYIELDIEIIQEVGGEFLIVKLLKIKTISKKISELIKEIKEPIAKNISISSSHPLIEKVSEQGAVFLDEEFDPDYLNFKKHVKILIIDNIKDDCIILNRYLKLLGYENIRIAMDGFQGLHMVEEENPDLILMDIDIPRIGGMEMLLLLREKIINQELMVLMISAYDSMENVVICIKMGAVDFLSEPFNQDLLKGRMEACIQKKWFLNKNSQYRDQIKKERNRYENLLYSVFPASIVKELAETNKIESRIYDDVAVLFTDIVGFTSYCEEHSLEEISSTIQIYAEICEKAAMQHNLQKLKTIGDGFMAVGGMMSKSNNPVTDCLNCAIQIIHECNKRKEGLKIRAGVDVGSVIGGIVGYRQYLFDIWGDVVNTCARVLACAEPDSICLTSNAWERCGVSYQGESLGYRAVKGKAQHIEIFQVIPKDKTV